MKSLQLAHPHLLVAIGIPGAGKSSFASKFADTFNAPFIDYAELQELGGNTDRAEKIASYTLERLFLGKQTIVMDGRGSTTADRKDLIAMADKNGYVPVFIWIQTEPATAEHRAVHAKDATMSLRQFDDLVSKFQIPGKNEHVIVISGKHTYNSQARMVLTRLAGERRPAIQAQAAKPIAPPRRIVPERGKFIR